MLQGFFTGKISYMPIHIFKNTSVHRIQIDVIMLWNYVNQYQRLPIFFQISQNSCCRFHLDQSTFIVKTWFYIGISNPGNVLLSKPVISDLEPLLAKFADFGFAYKTSRDDKYVFGGRSRGTEDYYAPEICRIWDDLSPESYHKKIVIPMISDIFACVFLWIAWRIINH